MENNKALLNEDALYDVRVERAKLRILRLHRRLGTWRKVQLQKGLKNVRYAYEFAVKGIIPKDREIRRKLGLPKILAWEHKPRLERPPLPIYMQWWRKLNLEQRSMLVEFLYGRKTHGS